MNTETPLFTGTKEIIERQGAIRNHLAEMDPFERMHAQKSADVLLGGGELARSIVIIPVAAHQEAPQIARAMAAYAGQKDCDPFTIVLGLNYPPAGLEDGVQATRDAIVQAKLDHPQLDIRVVERAYQKPTIGTIRRDLWNGVLAAAWRTGHFKGAEDTLAFNHDIDLVSMSPHYVARFQRYFARFQERGITDIRAGSRLKHARSPEHPNVSKVVFWEDLHTRLNYNTYEAGLAVTLGRYAECGGFDPTSRTHESRSLNPDSKYDFIVPGSDMQTSPRRYVDRLGKHSLADIWTAESFTAHDKCRRPRVVADISEERAYEIIAGTFEDRATDLLYGAIAVSLLHRQALAVLAKVFNTEDRADVSVTHDELKTLTLALIGNMERTRANAACALRHFIGSAALSEQFLGLCTGNRIAEITNEYMQKLFKDTRVESKVVGVGLDSKNYYQFVSNLQPPEEENQFFGLRLSA